MWDIQLWVYACACERQYLCVCVCCMCFPVINLWSWFKHTADTAQISLSPSLSLANFVALSECPWIWLRITKSLSPNSVLVHCVQLFWYREEEKTLHWEPANWSSIRNLHRLNYLDWLYRLTVPPWRNCCRGNTLAMKVFRKLCKQRFKNKIEQNKKDWLLSRSVKCLPLFFQLTRKK